MSIVSLHQRLVSNQKLIWYEQLLLFILKPIALGYGIVGWVRNRVYDYKLLATYSSTIPVISVGNIAVGGTGKTPVVDWLVKEFIAHGKRPAIISRGYSGNYVTAVGTVLSARQLLMTAAECGDEPYLLAQRNRECMVVVAKKRVDGIKVVENSGNIDVIILDDGFQHRAVQRNVDLVLLDSCRPLGNGSPLPAGNLREFASSLQRADFILMTRGTNWQQLPQLMCPMPQLMCPKFTSNHKLATVATDLNGNNKSVAQLAKLKLLAFAGVANPQSFFSSLSVVGIEPAKQLSFSDHAGYQTDIIKEINTASDSIDALITTEKDGVKLIADMFSVPCYQIGMDIEINNSAALFDALSLKLWS